jgi:hypothetical protein
MLNRLLIPLFILFFLAACTSNPVEIPPDVLSSDKLIPVLTDIHLAEAMLQIKNLGRNDSTRAVAYGYYAEIFRQHKITAEQFRRSMDFYVSQPDLMSAMYDSVITQLSTRNLNHQMPASPN